MKKFLLLLIVPFLSFGQNLPIIYAEGGIPLKGWSEESGFISSNCYQGITLLKASSSLKPQGSNSYYIKNLNDYNHKTAWVEGKSDYGIGEYFVVESTNLNIIYNGYQKSKNSWKNNSRVKRFKIYKDGKPLCYLKLNDNMGAQYFVLPIQNLSEQLSDFKFEIIDVYKGDRWNDVAITHLDYKNCNKTSKRKIEKKEGKTISECLVGIWCYPNCNKSTAVYTFRENKSFSFQSNSFGGLRTWGTWQITGNKIKIKYTGTSTGDVVPDQTFTIPDCGTLQVGQSFYNKM